MNTLATRTIDILMAEDNPGDVRLTREAFNRGQLRPNLHVAENGEMAMAFLRRQGEYLHAVRPDLILLDLNMPRKDGRAVLTEIKQDPLLDCIPIIVFTSSDSEVDMVKSYKLHANCYISKPVDINRFREVVRAVEDFWLNVARLPKDCGRV